jgi:hypothetical protein
VRSRRSPGTSLRGVSRSLHPLHACAYCGGQNPEVELRRAWLPATEAEAVVCVDHIECLRRLREVR